MVIAPGHEDGSAAGAGGASVNGAGAGANAGASVGATVNGAADDVRATWAAADRPKPNGDAAGLM